MTSTSRTCDLKAQHYHPGLYKGLYQVHRLRPYKRQTRYFTRLSGTQASHRAWLPGTQARYWSKPTKWDGKDPMPKLSDRAIDLQIDAGSLDGLALFQLCQAHPNMEELRLTASSFNSPVQGQWQLKDLEKLCLEFSDLSEDARAIEDVLKHAETLYLKELSIKHTGPGFAILHGRSLAKLNVGNLLVTGFDIRGAASLVSQHGQLHNCLLDASQYDLDLFYRQQIEFSRCRLREFALSRRALVATACAGSCVWLFGCLAASDPTSAFFLGTAGLGISYPVLVLLQDWRK